MKRATKFELLRWTQKLSSSIPKRSVSRISFDAPLQEGALSKMRLLGRERGGDRLANWYTFRSFSEFADKACSLRIHARRRLVWIGKKRGAIHLEERRNWERERERREDDDFFKFSLKRGRHIFWNIKNVGATSICAILNNEINFNGGKNVYK